MTLQVLLERRSPLDPEEYISTVGETEVENALPGFAVLQWAPVLLRTAVLLLPMARTRRWVTKRSAAAGQPARMRLLPRAMSTLASDTEK